VMSHSTPGPVTPVAGNLDLDDALALLDEQAERLRKRPARVDPSDWARVVGADA